MSELYPQGERTRVLVRRQWNDWRETEYYLDEVADLHWSDVSGGIKARAPRSFIYGYVLCDGMLSGELAHSCRHGAGPHSIKVCLVKSVNKEVWKNITIRLQRDLEHRANIPRVA